MAPYGPRLGTPPPEVASCRGGLYGEPGGWKGPTITSAVVLTTVPVAARGCSQSSSAVKSAGVIEYASHWLQRWWKTSCTHPPPCSSAAVTYLSIVASVVPR